MATFIFKLKVSILSLSQISFMRAIARIKQIALLLISIGFYIFTSCSENKEELPIINDGVTVTLTFEDGSTVDFIGAVVMNAIW